VGVEYATGSHDKVMIVTDIVEDEDGIFIDR
jgi:hypothetical protein